MRCTNIYIIDNDFLYSLHIYLVTNNKTSVVVSDKTKKTSVVVSACEVFENFLVNSVIDRYIIL